MRFFKLCCVLVFFSGSVYANDQLFVQLLWKHQFQFAGYYAAIEKGFYAEEGLDVELKEFDHRLDLVEEVITGRSQFAVGRTSLLIDKNAGADIVALLATYQHSPLMLLTRKDSGIALSSDLKDKNVMITNDAKKVGELMAMMLQTGITIGDFNQQAHSYNVQDLIDGKTDAMASYISNEPYRMDQEGVEYNMIHPRDYGFDMYSDLLFTSRKFMIQNPALTERFYRATIRGWLYAFENIEELANIIFDKYNSQNKTLDALIYEGNALKQLAFDDDGNFGTLTLDKFNQMAQVYLITGSIYRGYDFSDFIYRPLGNIHRFSKAEQSFLNSYPVIKICVNPSWAPYEFYANNQHQGMVADYFELIMSNVGLQYEIVPTRSWDDSLLKASLGECELIPGAMQTVQRSTYLNFTKPYLTIPAVVAIRSDSEFVSLSGKKIGVLKRSAFHDILEHRYNRSDIYPVASYLEGLRLVKEGEIDALAGADANLAHLIKEHQISDIRISDQLKDSWDIGIAITEFSPYLQNILNKSISSITPEQHSEIYDRWMVVEYKYTVDYTVLWWIGGVVAGIGLLVLYRFIKISTYNGVLKEMADKDALTGILSRRKLRDELENYIDLADRHGWDLSLIFFDIDDFKQVNDHKGHAVGDQVLIKVTKSVSDMTRKTDRFGRWGGEEFIFVMLETDLQAAETIAEKIRKKIEASDFAINQTVTCSFGVTEYIRGEPLEAFVSRADTALYAAKEGGKNSVTVC